MLNPKYRADIDGLRAIAVLAVVVFHAFPQWLSGGFVGVDIFFVISGYLITTIIVESLRAGEFSLVEFYSRRVKRIFPALLMVFLTCYVVGWYYLDTGDFSLLGKHIAGGAGFVSNIVLWQESGYFDPDANTKPLLHLWSLGVEEQFYLIWPLIVWGTLRSRASLSGVVATVTLVSFVYGLWAINHGSATAYYSPLSRFWELLAGSSLSLFLSGRSAPVEMPASRRNLLAAASLFAMFSGMFIIRQEYAFPGWWALLPVLGAVGIIASGPNTTVSSKILSHPLLVWFGLISFPLYLLHWPILTYWNLVTLKRPSVPLTFAMVLLSILVAWVVYRCLERPVRQRGRGKTVIALILPMLLVGLVGFNTFVREGLPFRTIRTEALKSDIKKYLAAPSNALNCNAIDDGYALPVECFNAKIPRTKPVVYLWGDSHTANFSYGMTKDKLKEFDINLLVAMRGACPPVLNYRATDTPKCDEFIRQSFNSIEIYKPDTVVLLASWASYFTKREFNPLPEEAITATVAALKQIGVKNVVIVGCFPIYEVSQPKLGARIFVAGQRDRTYERFEQAEFDVDRRVAGIARRSGAMFISPLDALCNKDGCLMSASRTEYAPMAYDVSHMTYPGSAYFIDHAVTRELFH